MRRLLPFLLATAWLLFWLFDQRFYDDDWFRWLNPSRELGWGAVLGSLLRPFPADWGFLERPLVMAGFKAGDAVFGLRPEPWFALKAALGGGLAAGAGVLASRFGGVAAGAMTTALVATAAPLFASLLWLSDSEAVAQLGVVVGVLLALRLEKTGRWQDGALLVVVGVLAWKAKASGKALPLILLGWLAASRPAGWRRVLPWTLALAATAVPWLALPDRPLPPMLASSEQTEWFYWQRANLDGWRRMLWGSGRLWPFASATALPFGLVSLVAPFGAALVGVGRGRFWRLLAPWIAVQLLVMGSYPDIPGALLGRYLLAIWVPLAVALGIGFARRPRWLLLPLLLQIAVGVHDTSVRKRTQGCEIVVADRARAWVEQAPEPQDVLLLNLPHIGGPEPTRHTWTQGRSADPATRERLRRGSGLVISTTTLGPPWRAVRRFDARGGWTRIQGPRLSGCRRTVWATR